LRLPGSGRKSAWSGAKGRGQAPPTARRYYDEHFATILDEDYVTVYTALPDLAAVWASKSYERGFTGDDPALWEGRRALPVRFLRLSLFCKSDQGQRLRRIG